MPQRGLMNEVVVCTERGGRETFEAGLDIPEHFHPRHPSHDNLDLEENNGFSTTDNHKKTLLSNNDNHFGRTPVNLQWRNITLKTRQGYTILKDLSGSASSGKLTAIMGPSGAGKTSLVNVLSGFTQNGVNGQILLNGEEIDMTTFRTLSCYVLQEDYILPHFTVRELITFASTLKMPTTVSEKERQRTVDDCIYSLGLVSHQNQRANTLSGGQRKRLCIAQEIVSDPPLIFLDEPTSGLDSASCLQCMQLLKSLAEQGRNVICTIHQPNSTIYETFDNLYMISEGHCIYRGPTDNLLPFLQSQGLKCPEYHSPTDFITDIAIGLYGDWSWRLKTAIESIDDSEIEWCQTNDNTMCELESSRFVKTLCFFRNNVQSTKASSLDERHKYYATGFCNQFKVLFLRSYLSVVREPVNLKVKFFGNIAIGLILGCLFYNTGNDGVYLFQTSALLFSLLIYLVSSSKAYTIITFPLQKAVFEREHMNGWYSIQAYYLARTAADIPFQIFFPVIVSSLVYWLTGQPSEISRYCLFLISTILISLVADSIGLIIGASTTFQNGVSICGTLTTLALVFSGHMMSINDTPVYLRWLYYVTYTRYGFRSMFLSLYTDRQSLSCSRAFCPVTDPATFIRVCYMDGSFIKDIYVMIELFLIFRIASYFILKCKVSRKRAFLC